MGIFHRFLDGRRRRADRLRGRRRRRRDRPARGDAHRRRAGRAARRPHLPAAGRRRPDHRVALDLAPASTTRASGRSTPGCATPAGRVPRRQRRRGDGRARAARADRGHPPRDRERARVRRRARRRPRARAGRRSSWSTCSGRGDKDVDTAARWFGLRDRRGARRGGRRRRRHRSRRMPRASGSGEHRHEHAELLATLATRAGEGRAALVGYLPAGFPTYDGAHRGDARDGRGRCRRGRGRPARTPTR